ncbi:hypothetical protein GW764_01570 [Candidatus Parcubacteria bacterium]|nr:hypothetical protein [Candidatus Parcubacteria bacterium]
MEKLIFKYNTITNWINNADQKANIAFPVEVFILGFVIKELPDKILNASCVYTYIFVFTLMLGISSIFLLLKTIRPELKNKEGNSKIFFKDINDNYKKGKIDIFDLNQNDKDFEKDLENQILQLSVVCTKKQKAIYWVTLFIFLQILLVFLIFI